MTYLDHSATSFPKPREVVEEVRKSLTQYGGNPGRGAHTLSLAAAKKIFECRCLAAELFQAEDPDDVCFTLNTTHALNTVIKGILKQGDHVLISDLEHNAVFRPVFRLAKEGIITYDVFPSLVGDPRRNEVRICAMLARMILPNTKMVIATAASNICSATLPLRQIGAFCRRHGILFVVDGAQGAGHLPLLMEDMSIDALCLPGHKGLQGPQGCGLLILRKNVLPDTLLEGGNGIDSMMGAMSDSLPERYEAGTLPTPSIAGLGAGLQWVKARGIESIGAWERTLYRKAREGLGNVTGVHLYVPEYEGAVLLFNVKEMPSESVASLLNQEGICVRAGYHCSALGHQTLGTPDGGAVRASFGGSNQPYHVDRLVDAVNRISRRET